MTLLESITAAADDLSLSLSNFPIITNADDIFPNLQPSQLETLIGSQTLIRPASGWTLPELDSDLNDLSSDLALNLKPKLKNPKTFAKSDFVSLVNSFFKKNSFKVRIPIVSEPNPLDSLNLNFTYAAIEKLGFLVSRDVSSLIAEGCVLFELWDVLRSIIEKGIVGNLISLNLVEKLVEKNQPELICLCVRKIPNLRDSEVYAMLNFFLSPPECSYDGMVKIRKEWEKEAILAIEKVKGKGKDYNMARDASILLMMAHDGFYSFEICLHYVFGSKNFDGLVLSSAIAKLDGFQVVGLVRYFIKLLEKYERFPEARACNSAREVLGLSCCESVPTLEDVVMGLRLVLDEHFSYLVLNTEFRDELKKAKTVVGELAAEANLCCPVDDVVKRLKEMRKLEGV